jgi:tetratricopeptide (TPR) repeat protein
VRIGQFTDISGVSGFDFPDDARALAVVDWDHDGDLDVWVSNRTGPQVRFLRNNDVSQNHFLSIKLEGTHCNRDAIGARVTVELAGEQPKRLFQTLKAGESYLSQSSKWLHFGLGRSDAVTSVEVRWPSGERSSTNVQTIQDIQADRMYRIVQGDDEAKPIAAPSGELKLAARPKTDAIPDSIAESGRVLVVGRIPLPPIPIVDAGGSTRLANPPAGKPLLLNLWASWCGPCLAELNEWSGAQERLKEAEIDIVLASVDNLGDQASPDAAKQSMAQLRLPFTWGFLSTAGAVMLDECLGTLQRDFHRPLGVPTSLLIDRSGQVAVIYRGRVAVEQVLQDVSVLDQTPEEVRLAATPFAGTWLHPPQLGSPLRFAGHLKESNQLPQAETYLRHVLALAELNLRHPYAISSRTRGDAAFALGSLLAESGRYVESIDANRVAAELLPDDFRPHANLGSAHFQLGQTHQAIEHLSLALQLKPGRESVLLNRASAYIQLRRADEALKDLEQVVKRAPNHVQARQSAAALYFAAGNDRSAAGPYRQLLKLDPESVDTIGALAWILATSGDGDLRDGALAKQLAETWCQRTSYADAKALNALAAAHAELGQFDQAIQSIQTAIQVAQHQQETQLANLYQTRLELFRQQQPIRRQSNVR